MTKKVYNIPGIHESLAVYIVSGKITIEEAACELNRCNYTPYVDVERTRKMLESHMAKIIVRKGREK